MHKQDQKGPKKGSLLAQETNFFSLSSPLMDWSSHGQNFAQNLMKRFPYMYYVLLFESIVIAFKEAAKDNNHMSNEDV